MLFLIILLLNADSNMSVAVYLVYVVTGTNNQSPFC